MSENIETKEKNEIIENEEKTETSGNTDKGGEALRTEKSEKTKDTEKIGKVTLDLSLYPGKDLYSDGEIEEKLLRLAKSVDKGEKIENILITDRDWPVLYHFSDIRKNILDWYDFKPGAKLLEIGAGCGAVTGLFCERCAEVTGIELSKMRSSINAYRNSKYDNLTIKVGNFEDIERGLESETFDYVTLIGVFEYSVSYIHSEDPYTDMLKKAKRLLKPGGVLFIAIENKYGLKYFAGAMEDHSGVAFEGIEGYPADSRVRTFSKRTLTNIITEAGFEANFYYPYPDYKMPTHIFSDYKLPGPGDITGPSPAYDRPRALLFNEAKAFNDIVKEGYFPEFSNSFLVICRKGK